MTFSISYLSYGWSQSGDTTRDIGITTLIAPSVVLLVYSVIGTGPGISSIGGFTSMSGTMSSWTKRSTYNSTAEGVYTEVWWASAPSTINDGLFTITYASAIPSDGAIVTLIGVNGVDTTSPFDGNASFPAFTSGTSGTQAATGLTTNASSAFVVAYMAANSPYTQVTSLPSGFSSTFLNNTYDSNIQSDTGYEIISSALASDTVTWGAAGNGVMYVEAMVAEGAPSPPAIDGSSSVRTGGASTSVNLTTSNADDLICVAVSTLGASVSVSSVTATGLTFTKVKSIVENVSGTFNMLDFWTAPATATLSSKTITVNLSASVSNLSMSAFGVSGLNSTSSAYDPNVLTPLTTAANPITALSLTTTNPDDLLVYLATSESANGNGLPPTGYTQFTGEGGVGFVDILCNDLAVSSTQSGVSVITASTPSAGAAMLVAFTADPSVTNYNLSVFESGDAEDSPSEELVTGIFDVTVTESGTATATQSGGTGLPASVSETMTAADISQVIIPHIVNEAMHAADTAGRTLVHTASVAETMHATDTPVSGIHLRVAEILNATDTAGDSVEAPGGIFLLNLRDILTATDTASSVSHRNASVAETMHVVDLTNAGTNGVFSVSVIEAGHLVATQIEHMRTNSAVQDILAATDHVSGIVTTAGHAGILNLSIHETGNLVDHIGEAQTFTTPGLYFWNYLYAYPGTMSCWIAGLDCGDWPIAPDGSVFVPWRSDPDGLYTPAWLINLANNPPENGFGPLACNVDLTTNTGTILRIVVSAAIGHTYTSRVQLLAPNSPELSHSQFGPSFGTTRRLHQYAARVVNAGQMKVGTDANHLLAVQFRQPNGAKYPASQLFTGTHWDQVDDDYSYEGELMVEIDRPYPATITALGGFIKTNDRD